MPEQTNRWKNRQRQNWRSDNGTLDESFGLLLDMIKADTFRPGPQSDSSNTMQGWFTGGQCAFLINSIGALSGVWLGAEPAGLHFFTGHSGIWRQDIVSLQARYGLFLARHRFAVDKSLFAGVVSNKAPGISASQELPRLQNPGRAYEACSRA